MFLIDPYRFAAAAGYDTDAQAYITAVETADGQALETAVKDAINGFVVGCKADNIWSAIKASCILAGARTLSGALVPLAGAAPTNFNFVSGDYDRETGLLGNGTSKYLNSNRTANADPQNSHHMACYVSTALTNTATGIYMGADGVARNSSYPSGFALRQASVSAVGSNTTGLRAASRTSASNVNWITGASTGSYTATSASPPTLDILVFARSNPGASNYANARLAFYSIGESLDLALLDARVSTLISAFATAIP